MTLIWGSREAELRSYEDVVLSRLSDMGLRLNFDKCRFEKKKINYLGHEISQKGLKMLDDRVTAVKEAPPPSDMDQLRSRIGKITFYDQFLPKRATVFAPLYKLLRKDTPWIWGPEQDAAFARCKELLF